MIGALWIDYSKRKTKKKQADDENYLIRKPDKTETKNFTIHWNNKKKDDR